MLAVAKPASTPVMTGTAFGGVVQTRHYVSSDGTVVADDTSTYRGTFTFTLRVRPNGTITGSGSGRYVEIAWHETGTVGGAGFSCDAPKTANGFAVSVGGRVTKGAVHLSLRLPAATEVLAADVDCGHGHTLVQGTTTYLRDSLAAAGGADVRWKEGRAAVVHLTKHADFTAAAAPPTAPGTFHVVQQHSWTIRLKGR
jgi:hypothetical protein